jgi:hypothetical protein
MAPGDESDIFKPPQSSKQPWRAEQSAAVFTVFLVIAFILANMLGAFKSVQAMSAYGYGWDSKFGFVVVLQFATHVVRCFIAALYFLKFRWFYWMLLASMVVVYLFPTPPYPIGIVNTPGLIGLVVLIGVPLVFGERRYVYPWRPLGKPKGGD